MFQRKRQTDRERERQRERVDREKRQIIIERDIEREIGGEKESE